jgi:hypothetical protein
MVTTEEAVLPGAAFPTAPTATVDETVHEAKRWLAEERAAGTKLGAESLWGEAYRTYLNAAPGLPEGDREAAWACIAASLVFDTGKVPLNQRTAASEACEFLVGNRELTRREKARQLQRIADRHRVDSWKIRSLLAPGTGCPWLLPRALWSRDVVVRALEAVLAPLDWSTGEAPDGALLAGFLGDRPAADMLAELESRAPEDSPLRRSVSAVRSLVTTVEAQSKDVGVIEAQAFISSLPGYGLPATDTTERYGELVALRDAVVLHQSLRLSERAESLVQGAVQLRRNNPRAARRQLTKAANIYKRLAVAQLYPERVLDRHQQIVRWSEELTVQEGLPDERSDHVLLISTYQSPADLQRLLLSVAHELMGFGYGRQVRLVVTDGSTADARATNARIFEEAARSGLDVSAWDADRRDAFVAQLNAEVFPDGDFDVSDLVGMQKKGEKGVPYGRIRNFLRLAALKELREQGLDEPVYTWLDHDNELGALVLTKDGTLDKRHVFNYFEQKGEIFTDPKIKVGGGGYTNDALEGVEKFWVAWGILHSAFGLAREHAPEGPAVLDSSTDITRFRPWDQSDTLERLPREGEGVETMSDQFLLLLNTLAGAFRGKYDNQVQIYHPWSYGYVEPEEERLVEELRPFAGMPGGNTSFQTDVLASSIPFITVPGRGEDIFHLWQLEGSHGPGSICLTHTPALHTRNVSAGRGDLMAEIVNSYNGRIFREPPYLWAAMNQFFAQGQGAPPPGPEVEAATAERIEGLRGEALDNIAAVSGFASEVAQYLDDKSEFWWMAQAENDTSCAEVLANLRELAAEYQDVERHQRAAVEQLIDLDEVKDLTARFLVAYPHWQTLVEHVSGIRPAGGVSESAAGAGPREDYGSPMRAGGERAPAFVGRTTVEPALMAEPVGDPPWHEALTASLLLFRRYERGLADQNATLDLDQRIERLRAIYEHHAAQVGDVPPTVWPTLFRDALFVPRSAPYEAVTRLLVDEGADVARVADEYGVDAGLLRAAVAGR